jgi:hypothetical protein
MGGSATGEHDVAAAIVGLHTLLDPGSRSAGSSAPGEHITAATAGMHTSQFGSGSCKSGILG